MIEYSRRAIMIKESCACVNTLLILQTMASIKCQYNADKGKHARKSRNHHLAKDLANQLHISYTHAVNYEYK